MILARTLGKLYRLYDRPEDRLKDSLFWRLGKTYGHEFWALRDISFEVHRGEVLGIIGRNGSGKSTLLQILAGVLQPTTGALEIGGRVAALLELGSGFNPEFTGRENVFLNGAILGLSRRETARRFDEIADFADIGDFIDQPVRLYSSGMFVRLAFAISTAVDADVLAIDEALAVGDVFFRQKCYRRLAALRAKGTAIVLVSHAMADVEQFCDRALVLQHGSDLFQGAASDAVKHYYLVEQQERTVIQAQTDMVGSPDDVLSDAGGVSDFAGSWPQGSYFSRLPGASQVSNGWAHATRLAICNEHGQPCRVFQQGERAVFYYEFELLHDIEFPIGGIVIQNDKGIHVHGKSTLEYGSEVPSHVRHGAFVRFKQEIALEIAVGEYTIEIGFATVSGVNYRNRAHYGHDELTSQVVRLAHVPRAGEFAVVFRENGRPVQLLHHGVANLPGICEVNVAIE